MHWHEPRPLGSEQPNTLVASVREAIVDYLENASTLTIGWLPDDPVKEALKRRDADSQLTGGQIAQASPGLFMCDLMGSPGGQPGTAACAPRDTRVVSGVEYSRIRATPALVRSSGDVQ